MNDETLPALAGQVEPSVRPRAWAKPTTGGDYLRSEPAMADTPEAEDGLTRCGWIPLYAAAPLSEGALMGVYMEFDRHADKSWTPAEYLLRFAAAVQVAVFAGPNAELSGDQRP
jgi:hypothetical protein